ncbi:MAG TPA: hypothetical protein PLJ16_07630, partial [Casimicrobium huifangae]|nr:hypothetical protein [Casimicrobium huifangae]
MVRTFLATLLVLLAISVDASAAVGATHVERPPGVIDRTPRVAVICAFEPELSTLLKNVTGKRGYR